MKNRLYSVTFWSILALGLLSDELMDKLGPVGYIAVGGVALTVADSRIVDKPKGNRRETMKGTFKITLDYLKELGACKEGQQEFQRVFPDGGEYQEVLDRCAAEGRLGSGRWLLDHLGPTEDVRVYKDAVIAPDQIIIFAGRIEFESGAKVKAIQAGEDSTIFAGLNILLSLLENSCGCHGMIQAK